MRGVKFGIILYVLCVYSAILVVDETLRVPAASHDSITARARARARRRGSEFSGAPPPRRSARILPRASGVRPERARTVGAPPTARTVEYNNIFGRRGWFYLFFFSFSYSIFFLFLLPPPRVPATYHYIFFFPFPHHTHYVYCPARHPQNTLVLYNIYII